ncbi:MAG: S8 family serine peptidase [Verrucomicrobiota bacterium]
MRPKNWFFLSIALFIAAAFFWHLGEKKRLASPHAAPTVPAQTSQSSRAPHKIFAKSSSSKKRIELASDASTKPDSTNAKSLYPNRLSNTTKTIDQLSHDNKAILLRNALIDTGAGRVSIPNHLRAKGDPGSYIVQSKGPLTDIFRAQLAEAKAQIISYVPNNAYLVRMSRDNVEALRGIKSVQAILPFEPYYKLDTELLDLAVKNEALSLDQPVRVTWFPGQNEAGATALAGKGSVLSVDLKSSPFGPESIVATEDLVALANIPEVQGIEPFYERGLLNDLTRVRLGVSTNSLTSTPNYQNLTGSNVLVNVNDTSIDNGHPDLTPRIFVGPGVTNTDEVGHGTHVAGIIASSGVNGPTGANVPGSAPNANFRGKAPAANIFSLDIFAGLADSELQETAARTNLFGFNRQSPLISNNSWGYPGSKNYNSASASYDMAVRDAIPGVQGSQPIIYVFAAGNSGGGNNNGQGGSAGSVISPSTAKNVITVGALESPRFITNDVIRKNRFCNLSTNKEFLGFTDSSNEVAFFSSRGNVGIGQEGTYGRLKPDVVEPGTFILSTRSRQFDEGAYYSTTNYDVRTIPNLILDPGATNRFSIFVSDDPCDEGRALRLRIDTLPNSTSPDPFPPLQIFVNTNAAVSASSNPANFVGTNSVTLVEGDPQFFRGVRVYCEIVNTNNIEVSFNRRTEIMLTNDYGNYFDTLRSLNATVAPNYFFESGTSMAGPATSGMLALVQEFFEQTLPAGIRRTNSPAMMKALLINSARSPDDLLYKLDANSTLNIAGWGLPNLTRILPTVLASEPDTNKWPIQMFDQSTNSALATGEAHSRTITVADTNSPLRVTLVWTDPPGNPQVGIKLVNDLDLVIKTTVTNGFGTNVTTTTNVYLGNHFSGGGQFTDPVEVGTNSGSFLDSSRDVVNNVENVYINGPLSGTYEVSVVARRVNVNAVTAHTNGVVQDYALVISSGNLAETAPFAVAPIAPPPSPNTNGFVQVIGNGTSLLHQRVGANSPLIGTNVGGVPAGSLSQWNFYVLNNPSNQQNVAFLTFLPPNISGTTNVSPNSRRNIEADIDLYVSTDPTLTNLNPAAIAGAMTSRKRGGQELIVLTNATSPVYYVGVKSEDQQGGEFGFFGVTSDVAFSQQNANGDVTLNSLINIFDGSSDIPDGSNSKPGGAYFMAIATEPINVARVVVTNRFTHERFGDLIGTITHNDLFAVLNNHSFPIILPLYPEGQESGTFEGIYDDSGLMDIPNSRPVDGPGSLNDFIGQDGIGSWMLAMEDNALNATGRVEYLSLFLERALETNQLFGGGSGFAVSGTIPPQSSRGISFVVPADATNMIISIAPKEGALDTVVRRGILIPTRNPYVDKGTNISPPGGKLTWGLTEATPPGPLKPGRHVLRLYNDGGAPVTLNGSVEFELNLTAASFQTYVSGGSASILDDAVTNSVINVKRSGRLVDVEVGVRIDHPRISDLVLHLVSPEGPRVLLAENRGGLTTNGYGFSNLTTNVVDGLQNGDNNPATNTIPTTSNSGLVSVDYDFFDVADQLQIFYDGFLLFDSGMVVGAGTVSVPFGPGIASNVVIVINGEGNTNATAWEYTATILSGQLVYATFSENTNLALVPIKFALPPFGTNLPGSNVVVFMTSDFETEIPGTFATGSTVDGWSVVTNSVAVENLPGVAYSGSNYLNLGNGAVARTLPSTDPSKIYNLKFSYKRAPGSPIGGAKIGLSGVYTNEFIGSAGWIPFSQSFGGVSGGSVLQLDGTLPNMLFDTFSLSEGGDPNYFLPEESLKTFIGEQSLGDWKLEIWDSRAGQPLSSANLLSWKLDLTFTSSNATAVVVDTGVGVTNTVNGNEIKYFIIDVPLDATHATNILQSFGGPLNLLFNQNQLPVGSAARGDYTFLSVSTGGSYDLNTLTGPPYLLPGRRYYLGVQNANRSQTNQFSLRVDFDNTNNLVEVTPLFNAIPVSTNLPTDRSIHYYQYDLSNTVGSLTFTLTGLSGDVDLVVRRGTLPSPSQFDYNSTFAGTLDETIVVPNPSPGRYYVGVYGFAPTNGIDYTVTATEAGGVAVVPAPVFLPNPTVTPTGFQVTATTVVGRMYEFQVSTDLITWTMISTTTATSILTTFTDNTPPSTQVARFYRLLLLPP